MILGGDGQRLSKRHGAVSVLQYREDGYLPEALLNYLLRLGWSHGDQEIFSKQEMIDKFGTEAINKAAAAFNYDKLQWLNKQYLKTIPTAELLARLGWHLDRLGIAARDPRRWRMLFSRYVNALKPWWRWRRALAFFTGMFPPMTSRPRRSTLPRSWPIHC